MVIIRPGSDTEFVRRISSGALHGKPGIVESKLALPSAPE
jgi:hypothetical protein